MLCSRNCSKDRKRDEEGDVWPSEKIKQGLEQEHIEYSPRGFFSALF